MARISIDKLPDGFTIRNGKVVREMAHGGTTGDQYDYHLTTVPTNLIGDQVNKDDDKSIRYSLSSVPRDLANLEAEGGETVLTDLNDKGQFGLYDIKGPSHDDGGVPMRLPDQSFIFSRDPSMEIEPQVLADAFGINTSKAMTPAQVSRKFQLNNYNVQSADPNSDYIARDTADAMLMKNKMALSKLAFIQESIKRFADGVPVASFPYLQSQGVNPVEFKQEIEQISEQEAQQALLDQLPPEERDQIMQQAQFMAQMQQAQQQRELQAQMQQQMQANIEAQPEGVEMPSMELGGQLSDFVSGMFDDKPVDTSDPQLAFAYSGREGDGRKDLSFLDRRMEDLYSPEAENPIPQFDPNAIQRLEMQANIADQQAKYGLRQYQTLGEVDEEGGVPAEDQSSEIASIITRATGGDEGKKQALIDYILDNPTEVAAFFEVNPNATDLEIFNFISKNAGYQAQETIVEGEDATEQTGEAQQEKDFETDEFELSDYELLDKLFRSEEEAWVNTTGRAYAGFKQGALNAGISEDQIPTKEEMINKFLSYQKAIYDLQEKATLEERTAANLDGRGNINNAIAQELLNKYGIDYKIDPLDTKLNQTFSQSIFIADQDNAEPYLRIAGLGPEQKSNWDENKRLSPVDGIFGNNTANQFVKVLRLPETPDIEKEQEEEIETETETIEVGDVGKPAKETKADFWLQDLMNLDKIARRERRLGLPFEPEVEEDRFTLELLDPTREIAGLTEVKNITDQSLAAFAPAQSFLARTAKTTGDVMTRVADTVSSYEDKNVGMINQGKYQLAGLQAANRREKRDRNKALYDNTQLALENYLTEKNFDREQYIDAYSNALTNMANTYNMNTLYDTFQIDPMSGGMVSFTGGKDLDPTSQSSVDANKQAYIEAARELKAAGLSTDNASIKAYLTGDYSGVSDVSQQDELRRMMENQDVSNLGYTTAPTNVNVQQRQMFGGPFSIGKMGI